MRQIEALYPVNLLCGRWCDPSKKTPGVVADTHLTQLYSGQISRNTQQPLLRSILAVSYLSWFVNLMGLPLLFANPSHAQCSSFTFYKVYLSQEALLVSINLVSRLINAIRYIGLRSTRREATVALPGGSNLATL
jgi:hypothetical protein